MSEPRPAYSARFVRFVRKHGPEYLTAYVAPNPQTSRALLERLEREYKTLPARHDCTCWCPNEKNGYKACSECLRLRAAGVREDVAVEIGRTELVNAPMPMTLLLDLERALSVLGESAAAGTVARWLSDGGD